MGPVLYLLVHGHNSDNYDMDRASSVLNYSAPSRASLTVLLEKASSQPLLNPVYTSLDHSLTVLISSLSWDQFCTFSSMANSDNYDMDRGVLVGVVRGFQWWDPGMSVHANSRTQEFYMLRLPKDIDHRVTDMI